MMKEVKKEELQPTPYYLWQPCPGLDMKKPYNIYVEREHAGRVEEVIDIDPKDPMQGYEILESHGSMSFQEAQDNFPGIKNTGSHGHCNECAEKTIAALT